MLIYNQQLAEIVMGQLISLFIDPEYNDLYRYNQGTNNNEEIIKIKEFAKRAKRAISRAQRIEILKVIKEVRYRN